MLTSFPSIPYPPKYINFAFSLPKKTGHLLRAPSPTFLKYIWKAPEVNWGILASQNKDWLREPYRRPLPPRPLARAMDLLVGFQGILALKGLSTLWAGEGPVVGVNVLVTEEERGVGEPAATVWTGVGLLACMRAPVDGQQVGVSEATFAVWAWVGLLPGVSPSVDGQGAPLAETSPTIRAGVRLFPSVDELMLEQVLALGETGLALVTGEGPLPGVDPPVGGQVGGVAEAAATV